MSQIRFEVGNAVMHFNRTGGPPGFLWKFGLTYAAVALLVAAAVIPFFMPLMAASFDPDLANDPDAMADVMMGAMGSILLGYLLAFVLGILLWAVLEAASQRRYIRGDGFRLRFGGDEARLLAVGFFWFVTFIVLYIACLILFMVPAIFLGVAMSDGSSAGLGLSAILALVVAFGAILLFIWVCARLSPAAALTIRDQRIRFFEAWRVTKGRVWSLIGSWLLIWLIGFAVFLVMYIVVIGIMLAMILPGMTDMAGEFDEAQYFATVTSPANIIVFAVIGFLFYAVSGAFMHIFSGPAALAAKTDPNWAGGVTETFV